MIEVRCNVSRPCILFSFCSLFLFQIQAHKQENLLIGMHAMSDMNTDILSKTEKLQSFIGRMFSLVEKIGYLQQSFHDHFTTYEMILFYTGSIIVTWISTSFPGVSRARPTLMCLTAVALAVEQCIVQYGFLVQASRDK